MVTRLRPARPDDQTRLADLIRLGTHLHRHLDWRPPLEWLGAPEYWLLERDQVLTAALACPPDPASVAWLRLFVHDQRVSLRESWLSLWSAARQALSAPLTVAAIGLEPWLGEILQESQFQLSERVVFLEYDNFAARRDVPPPGITLRPMNFQDLPAVAALDAAAFAPLWRNSLASLQRAFRLAGIASLALRGEEIVGYQISTRGAASVHLARLAVSPVAQRSGVGAALVRDLFAQAQRFDLYQVTVNTQASNLHSLALYQKLGFERTGESYPVYTYQI
ncbi:MAG: hypothetical protein Fur0035_10950 [Anaerolineales bacterium]